MRAKLLFLGLVLCFKSFAQMPLNGLVVSFPFDGNANDMSGFNNHGTVNGAILAEDRFGNPNKAYFFDGINDYINLGNNPFLSLNQNTTISLWYSAETQLEKRLFSKRENNAGLEIVPIQDSIFFFLGDQTSKYIFTKCSQLNIPYNTWHNLTFLINQTEKISTCYLDGLKQNAIDINSIIGNVYNQNPALLGANSGFNPSLYFKGKIDDFTVYNRLLSESEISQIVTSIESEQLIETTKTINKIYTLTGNEIPSIENESGFFIVRYTDGSTQKIFKK